MSGLTGSGRMFSMASSGTVRGGTVRFVELFGAIRPFEFMPLAGNGNQGNSHEQEREKFHRAAS